MGGTKGWSRVSGVTCLRWLVFVLFFVSAATGCAWETGSNPDAGDLDGTNGGDQDDGYPPGPYGTDYGDTIENFQIVKVLCAGSEGTGRNLQLKELLGAKSVLLTVHSGSCYYCREQAKDMEELYQRYKDQGLDILLVLISDERGSSDRDNLLDFGCSYINDYGMTFTVAVDPGFVAMEPLLREGTPLNILLDDQMVIRYRVEALMPETLEGNIQHMLEE